MSKSFDEFELSIGAGIEFIFSPQALSTILFILLMFGVSVPFSKPVAITVITISSSNVSSITAPNIIFASGSTLLCTSSAAVLCWD